MSRRLLRYAFVGSAMLVSLTVAQPALAYKELGTTGTVGAHSLTDRSGSPGSVCVYKFSSVQSAWQLKHIYVNPPNMKAVPGQGSEKVAWHFTVQRRIAGLGGVTPWKNRYTSPDFVAYTNSTHNASFGQKGVKVTVPFDLGGDASALYRSLVKLTWYRSNGTVLGTATERVEWYNTFEGLDTNVQSGFCSDYFM